MSEYVRKQAVLDRINTIRNAHIEKRNEGDECDQFANEAVADWLWAIQEEIQSGAFDAPEMEHVNAYWAREGLIKHQQEEIQRLRAALVKARQYVVNGYELGYIDDREGYTEALVREIDKALSTTTEPTGAERVREEMGR